MKEKISSIILGHRKKLIITIFFLLLTVLDGLSLLSANYNMRYWLDVDDPLIKRLNYFEQNFGNDESVVVGVYSERGVFNKELILRVMSLSDEISNIKEVVDVKSLLNVEIPYWDDQEQKIKALTVIDKSFNFKRTNELINDSKFLDKFFISQDKKMMLLIADLKPTILDSGNVFDEIDYISLTTHLRELKTKYESGEMKIFISGTPILQNDFGEISQKDMEVVMPLLLGLICIILYLVFKSILLVIGTVIITSLVNTFTMAFAGYLGFQIENLLSIVPMIVITISLADMIHIFQTYKIKLQELDKIKALDISIQSNLVPTFLTSFTTAIGFVSLYSSKLVPVSNMGTLSSIAIMLAWLISLILFPILLSYLPTPNKDKNIQEKSIFIKKYMSFLAKHSLKIIMLFTFLALVFGYLGTRNEVNTDPLKFFNQSTEVRSSSEFILSHFGSVIGPELIVYAQEREGVLKPDFLKKVEHFEKWLQEKEYIRKTISITDLGKEINRKVHGNDPAFAKIPETKKEIIDLYFDHKDKFKNSLSLGSRVSKDFDALRLSLFWNVTDTRGSLARLDEILTYAKKINLDAQVTGKNALYLEMNDYVVSTFFTSIIVAIIAVSLLMIVLFRSLKMGLISLIPNFIPLCFITGIMTLSGISIDIGTALVCSVCLGIAIDDTIHFFINFYRQEGSYHQRVESVLNKIGKALIVTSIILSAGFGLFMLSDFIPNYKFGFLCACTILFALIADIVLLPAFLIFLEKK